MSVLIITHKYREVMNFADEVTVLRKGQFSGSAKVPDVTPPEPAKMMVGSEVINEILARSETDFSKMEPVISLDKISVINEEGIKSVSDLSMDIANGEIVGIAGVSGNGQKQLVEVLAGQYQLESGCMKLHGEDYSANSEQMRKNKFHCLPEGHLKNARVVNRSVADNLAIRTHDEYQEIGKLSGGNVQRTVLARELTDDVDILIVQNPCFGQDFGTVAEIRKRIMLARNNGADVLLVSKDLDEILELSDWFYVISNGSLLHETTPPQANLIEIGQYMAGH